MPEPPNHMIMWTMWGPTSKCGSDPLLVAPSLCYQDYPKNQNYHLMFSTPRFRRIQSPSALKAFSAQYCKASGLAIPDAYLCKPNNFVFGIYYDQQLIGGFILGNHTEFRTVEVFASKRKRAEVEQQLGHLEEYTEICCFYIDRKFRAKARYNFFVWLMMTYALKRYGKQYFLFGTCSRSLARLYAQTPKSIPIHRDFIDGKATFIFKAQRNQSLSGMLEIIAYKLKRTLRLKKQASRLYNNTSIQSRRHLIHCMEDKA